MTEGKKKILIIEDESFLRSAMAKRFLSEGFDVYEATDGEQGLDYALKDHPDLILLDLLMPGLGGVGMLEKLRKDEWGKDAEVMILTNVSSAKEVDEAVALGVKEFLVKVDMKLDDVVKRVKEKLGK